VVQYDPKGNLTDSGNGFVYTYDSKNRLLSAVSAGMGVNLAMTYDDHNKVVSRTLNGTTRYFIYDGWSLIAEYNSTGDLVKRYVHGAGIDEILVQTQGSTDAFYHHDALGSTVLLTNASGNIVRSYEYDVFGQVSNPPSVDDMFSADPYANRFLYTGREFLKEANLYDYRNRVYSAELGRFLQTDPIRFDAGDRNLYRYVANGSVNFKDPLGLIRRLGDDEGQQSYTVEVWVCEATYNLKQDPNCESPCEDSNAKGRAEHPNLATARSMSLANIQVPKGCIKSGIPAIKCLLIERSGTGAYA
jgi:RHS repeat-associated protein